MGGGSCPHTPALHGPDFPVRSLPAALAPINLKLDVAGGGGGGKYEASAW